MVRRDKANYMIQSVTHALDVLEELAKGPGEIGVTELSKRLKLHKNNVFRLLATLELRGFVDQNRITEDYRLGAKLLQLGQAYRMHSSLVGRATPILRALSEEIAETVSLATYQNDVIQYPVSFESKRPVRVTAREGMSFTAKSCAVGRLLTAQLPDAVLSEILSANTPQDAAIKSQLMDLRSSGQIIDRGASEADVVSVSRIVKDGSGMAVAAIEIVAPQYRAKPESFIAALDDAATKLSHALGSLRLGVGMSASIEKEISSTTSTSSTGSAGTGSANTMSATNTMPTGASGERNENSARTRS